MTSWQKKNFSKIESFNTLVTPVWTLRYMSMTTVSEATLGLAAERENYLVELAALRTATLGAAKTSVAL